MKYIDYRKFKNENEIKNYMKNKEILKKTIIIHNIIEYENLKEILDKNFYRYDYENLNIDYEFNKNELKKEILFDLKSIIMNEKNIINNKYLLEKIIIKENENKIIIFKDNNTYINIYKINNEKIFNECIKFLNIENENLKEYIKIIKKYNENYNKEIELKEIIKENEIKLNEMKKENYKIKNELYKKFNYELYYY